MPLYEYICNNCKDNFILLKWKDDEDTTCPKCGSKDVKKKLSTFSCPLPTGSTGNYHNPFSSGG
jgi:putative FmdB family regulatory protein